MNLNDLFTQLADNPSRNYKIDALNAFSQDATLKEVVRLALCPMTQFYQRKIPAYKPAQDNQADTLSSVLDSLTMLSSRKVTGNAAIEYLTKLLSSLVEGDAKVLERIIAKDLKCGVSISTANKVWPGLVMEYPCMLCSQYEEKLVDKIDFPAYAQLKMDGMRFNAVVRNGTVEFRSRNGKEIFLLDCLVNEFLSIANGKEYVFDGELLVEDVNGGIADRQTGNGILNKAVHNTITIDEASMVRATLWDVIPYTEFIAGKYNVSYQNRLHELSTLLDEANVPFIYKVEHVEVYSIDAAKDIFEEYLADGKEGIILKDKRGIWENKRTKSQIKFKGELECDLKIVGIEEGTGKNVGKLGAIIVESADSKIRVAVGTGFSDIHRDTFNTSNIIGNIVAVKYNSRIVNKQGEHSLFLPVFVEMRTDKDVADSSEDIK